VDNLPGLIEHGGLYSDAKKSALGLGNTNIGMNAIKQRRLNLPVDCHQGTSVGEYVPFYFCPRSIMLYLLYMGNHPDLTYKDGQNPIVHLVSSLKDVFAYSEENRVKWAFTATNAGARYTQFYDDLSDLGEISWKAVRASDFRDPEVKEGKQAEFLMYDFFPWELIAGICVKNKAVCDKVKAALKLADHKPDVQVKSNWYY